MNNGIFRELAEEIVDTTYAGLPNGRPKWAKEDGNLEVVYNNAHALIIAEVSEAYELLKEARKFMEDYSSGTAYIGSADDIGFRISKLLDEDNLESKKGGDPKMGNYILDA